MKNSERNSLEDVFGPVVASYTRAQAIDDGVLVDATRTAREVGFKWPVALTQAAWCDCVAWSDSDSRLQVPQDESGRLWDVLFMACYSICSSRDFGERLHFSLFRVPKDGRSMKAVELTLKLIVGPGDAGEPVVTILLPHED